MSSLLVTLPLRPGQEPAARAFLQECMGPRFADFDASERRFGIAAENWYLQHSPAGPVLVAYIEGENLTGSAEAFVGSREPFDAWFKEQIRILTGHDFNAGPPAPEMIAEILAEYRAAA
jgi:hypothetical protein